MPSTLRYLRQYFRPRPGAVETREVMYEREGEELDATVYRPAGRRGPLPGWVVLHGLTCQGREHESLTRFARAVAASGVVVLVPDIPEWRRLRVAPAVTAETIRAAVLALDARGDVADGRTGVIGFSFGATQALVASVDERVEAHLSGIAAWGGYCDLERVFRFGLTGEYALDGKKYRLEPDPYGGWIMAGNYLTEVPGHEDDADVADALYRLAVHAGESGIYAGDPVHDRRKQELRDALPVPKRPLFDLFAPPSDEPVPDRERANAMVGELSEAATRTDPLLDPEPILPRISVDVLVAHGRDDRLIPFTEGVRLSRALPDEVCASSTITALFEHSGGTRSGLGPAGLAREGARFLGLLRRILNLV